MFAYPNQPAGYSASIGISASILREQFHGDAQIGLLHIRLNDRPANDRDFVLNRQAHHDLFNGFIVPAGCRHPGADLHLTIHVVLFGMDGLQSHGLAGDSAQPHELAEDLIDLVRAYLK
jgi:hypothetical protein